MILPSGHRKIFRNESESSMDEDLRKKQIIRDSGMAFLLRASYVRRVHFGRDPAQLVCRNCGQFIVTETSRHNGVCSFFTVLVALFLCTPCAWLPLVTPTCKDTLHTCPNCGAAIGIHRYFK